MSIAKEALVYEVCEARGQSTSQPLTGAAAAQDAKGNMDFPRVLAFLDSAEPKVLASSIRHRHSHGALRLEAVQRHGEGAGICIQSRGRGLGGYLGAFVRHASSCITRWRADDGSRRWWFSSTGFPLIVGTLGPMATTFNICALIQGWRVVVAPSSNEAEGMDVADPAW